MTKTPIDPADIRKGDLIRWESRDPALSTRVIEFVAERDRHAYLPAYTGSSFLLDRPRKLLWPAGTHLWLTRSFYPWDAGDEIELDRDWFEDEHEGVTTTGAPNWMRVTSDAVTADRPTPPVDLPTEPTLGWLTWTTGPWTAEPETPKTVLAVWQPGEHPHQSTDLSRRAQMHSEGTGLQIPLRNITAFVPALAVPVKALDELCGANISRFLRAADKAAQS